MKKLSDSQLKIMVYVISALGIIGGLLLWRFIPYTFRNTSSFHVGNGEVGFCYGDVGEQVHSDVSGTRAVERH